MTVSTGWVRVLSDGDYGKSDTDEAMVCQECCQMAERAIATVIEQREDEMTDETRDEIVRLARKGWTPDQILDSMHRACPSGQQRWWTVEQVQAVIDEADREVERTLAPGQTTVPAANDAIGRIAKWLDEAREAGYGSRDMVGMLIEAMSADAAEREDDDPETITRGLADRLDAMAEDQG